MREPPAALAAPPFAALAALVFVGASPGPARAAGPDDESDTPRIRDNLFLLEEAYNQEPGVIQHISFLQYAPSASEWNFSFTEEWPVPDDLNQLSATLNLSTGVDGQFGLADVLLNYRLQAVGRGGKQSIAVAPRLSMILPTGNAEEGLGRGGFGIQVDVPLSWELSRFFVLHVNAGATVTPNAESPGGRAETAVDSNAGVALVWQPLTWMNALVETAHSWSEEVGDERSERVHELVVNPGLRFAIDHESSGLQVVPGVAAPIQLLPEDDRSVGVIAYLSFEHPAF